MTRLAGVLVIFVVVVGGDGCAQHRSLQSSSDHPLAPVDEATRLDAHVRQLLSEGRLGEAFPLAERSLALREKGSGSPHPELATSLINLADLYMGQGRYALAELMCVRALAIREKTLGAMHTAVAQSLSNLAKVLQTQGEYTKAEQLYIRALDIHEKVLGAMHPRVATSLNNLAVLFQAQGEYAIAEPLYIRALDIRKKALGAMHSSVANSLNNLAALYDAQGEYAKAEPLHLRALEIREKASDATPVQVPSQNNFVALYWIQGAYIEPETWGVRAVEEEPLRQIHGGIASRRWIRSSRRIPVYAVEGEKVKAEPRVRTLDVGKKEGTTNADVAISLNNLALHYEARGMFAKAEPLLLRARDINEEALGTRHPDVATSLNNLGRLYQLQGAYTKAESFLARALDIREKELGVTHPDVAISLDDLALLHWAQGQYTKAEPLCVRALNIREKALGAMHPDVAQSLDNVALLRWAQGAYETAEPLWVRALDIREKALGAMHPDVAQGLNNLGVLYNAQGEYAKAERLWVRALDIREKALGAVHPEVAQSLGNLAVLYQGQALHAKALPLLARATVVREAQLRLELARLSEPRKRALMMLLQKETDHVVSLHADTMPSSLPALELGLTTVLRRKGRVLDSLADNQATLRAHVTPVLRVKLDQLAVASTELSTRLRSSFGPRTAANRTSAIDALRTRVEQLESELNQASVDSRLQPEPATIAKIQAALPHGAALIEFIRYHRFDSRHPNPWQEERYVAYILAWQGPPQAVALGAAGPIDHAVDAVLVALQRSTSVESTKAALQHLDTLVLAPLHGQLAKVSHVILSPDGKLNLVPFEALIDPQGHYEMEQRLVSYVASGRDLLRLGVRRPPRSSATIVAAPNYGPPRFPVLNSLGTFRPLEGAAAEAKELSAYFTRARTLTGSQATKTALATTVAPAVLHVATHGFYARDVAVVSMSFDKSTPSVEASALPVYLAPSGSRGFHVEEAAFSSLPTFTEDLTDALDRAGLALAGANVSSDGIVSARELASYDWWGTQLVVLSACETGVGAVSSGEGVYGMRRALVLAGAESQVVSLWNVNDSSTRELMREFYGELARGTGRAEALRRAKLRLLRQLQFAHPYYWAAFIPAGDWTPLAPHLLKPQERGP